MVDEALQRRTFEVYLDEGTNLRWRYYHDGQEVVVHKEPQTTWGVGAPPLASADCSRSAASCRKHR